MNKKNTLRNPLHDREKQFLLEAINKVAEEKNIAPTALTALLLDRHFKIQAAIENTTHLIGLKGQPAYGFFNAPNARREVMSTSAIANHHFIMVVVDWEKVNAAPNTPQGKQLTQVDMERLARVREVLTKQFANPPLLDDLAREVGTSKSKLIKDFILAYGQSIAEYIHGLRMTEAEKLLRETDLPINEIARRVGYKRSSSFTVAFKRAFDYTAREWRKKIRNVKNRNFYVI